MIPFPFDLYVTTNNLDKKNFIDNYLITNSKAHKYEVIITPNKGRDVIPFLIQIKDVLNKYKYKYLCHIHTKKHFVGRKNDINWQHYLYENLLGDEIIIKKILSDFEINDKLGFIFPEHFYKKIRFVYHFNKMNYFYLDKILELLFPKMRIKSGNIINFPSGNMFWARTEAIYQIFNDRIINLAPEEKGQIDGTILHAIERVWLFLVKLNGFNYKTILYFI